MRSKAKEGTGAGAASDPAAASVRATRRAYGLHLRGRLAEAIAAYRRALELDEGRFDAWYALGCAEFDSGSGTAAVRCLRRALALRPGHARTQFDLGRALFDTGAIEAAIEHLRIAAAGDPELRREALGRVARYIPGSPRADNAAILAARREWATLEAATEGPPLPPRGVPSRRRKLRLGYCSAFFAAANWMKPVWGVINHHDRTRFAIHLFSDGDPPGADAGCRRDRRDRVHDVRGLSNRKLAGLVASLGIDVLVDLNGYSCQRRLGLFMQRPAPVNLGWFNMYATTGVDAFDYIVGDDAVIPPEEERFYSERVLRVPGSYIAFSVLYPVPEIVPPPCLASGMLTFGAFASRYKLTDEVIATWAEILRRAPRARLMLKNGSLTVEEERAAVRQRFARHGVQAERLLLEGPAAHTEFLAAYGRVDIALDTFPYNGGTTTTEALWQGVPVLAFNGDRWASRTSRSLLLAAGLGEWCAADRVAYVERAVTLAEAAGTPASLAALRATMRSRLGASPVCDSAGLCAALENIYRAAVATR